MTYWIQLACLFVAVFFAVVNVIRVALKNDIPAGNIIYMTVAGIAYAAMKGWIP